MVKIRTYIKRCKTKMAEFQSIQVSSAAGQFYLKNAVKETENDAPETFAPECNSFPNQLTKGAYTLVHPSSITYHSSSDLSFIYLLIISYDNNVTS